MAIVYRQISTIREWRRGAFSLRLSLSADYAAMFPDATGVDMRTVSCVHIGTLKEELEDKDGRFVEDELALELDSTTCLTNDEHDVLTLMLGAVDESTPCYILLEVAEGGSTTYQQAFRGVLRTDVQATDVKWYGAEYGTDPTPERVYKFAAKSYSVAVLDRPLELLIPDTPSSFSHPYWPEWSSFLNSVHHWLACGSYYDFFFQEEDIRYTAAYFTAMVDLNDVLRYLADRIVDDVGDPSLHIAIPTAPIDMTFGTPELKYGVTSSGAGMMYGDQAPEVIHRTTNSISNVKLGDGEYGPLVSLRLLQPITDANKPFSFRRSKTFSQLCYDLARPFDMFVQFQFDSGGDIVISFKGRGEIYKDEFGAVKRAYIRDVDSGSIKSQPTSINAAKESYQGFINQFAVEGVDVFKKDRASGYQRSELAKANPPGDRLLPVTIGATMMDTYDALYTNTQYRKLWNTGWYYRTRADVGESDPPSLLIGLNPLTFIDTDDPSLTTALFVRTTNEKLWTVSGGTVVDTGRRYESIRPVTQVDVRIDGVQESFTELAEYVNRVKGLDGKYYESEYELTVGALSAFRKTPDGPDSYFNIDLGTTIELDGVDYVIVGIERDFDAITTKLRLHALTRFSIFSKPTTVAAADIDGGAKDPEIPEGRRSNVETFPAGEDISAGWAVTINDSGQAIKARPITSHYNKVVGVALEDRPAGTVVQVCTSGVCPVPDSYPQGRALWLRDGDPNMDDDRIDVPSLTEHADQKIGTCVGAGLVEVNIGRPFIWFGFGG